MENMDETKPKEVETNSPSPQPGAKFGGQETQSVVNGQPTSTPPVLNQPKRRGRNIFLAILAVLLLAVGGWALMQLTKDESPTETPVVKREIPLLRVSTQDGPLNILYNGVDNDGAMMVNNHIYEGLVTYENVNKIVPLLATSWTNPDDETWIFTLKENVVMHSGNTMSANDVKASLDNASDIGQGGLGIDLKSVEVVDAKTIKLVTNGPDPLLLGRLVGIWISDSTVVAEEGKEPAGTGPYTVKGGTAPGENEIVLAAFDRYHGGTVYTRELSIKVMSTTDAVDAFNKQEIDIASALVSDSEKLNLPNQQLVTIKDFTVAFLAINTSDSDSPLSKLKVRQAIAKAIDPELVIDAQEVVGEPATQFVTRDIPGFNTEIKGYERSIEEAKTLLSEAGYPDGFTVSFGYASTSNDGVFDSLKTQLSAIGITLTKTFFGDDHDAFFGAIFDGSLELFFLAYSPEVLDASDTVGFLFSGDENPMHYNNAAVNDLLGQAARTLDEAERLNVLKDVGQALHDDVAGVPLYSRDSITALAQPYVVVRHMPNGGSGFKFNEVYLP